MKPIVLALVPVLLLLAIVLVGCGQKGPLFLPGENPHPPRKLLDNSQAANDMSQPDGADGATETTPQDTH